MNGTVKTCCFVFFFFLWVFSGKAQEEQRREYERFLQEQAREYDDFVSRRNREFARFLKQEWTLFQEMQAVERKAEPKPVRVPELPVAKLPPIPGPAVKPLPLPHTPDLQKSSFPQPLSGLSGKLEIRFYGARARVGFSPALKVTTGGVTEEEVAAYWEKMSTAPYAEFIEGLQQLAKAWGLNDWGYYRLVEAAAAAAIENPNERILFRFYILRQSGYEIRIGRSGRQLCLLVPFTTQVYGRPYFLLNGEKYYRLDEGTGPLYTFTQTKAPDRGKALDLHQRQPLAIPGLKKLRELKLEGYPRLKIGIPYYPARQAYYAGIPQTDLPVYFSCCLPAETRRTLYDIFVPLAEEHSLPEFVGILLHFVQTSFEYKTDEEQFGQEKYFYPEEVIAYPFCDCEDRSVFFSCLVRDLTGGDVVGLDYPGHVATAVCFGDTGVSGDAVTYRGKKYIICDPTYIRASVGMAMPQYRRTPPGIITFGTSLF